MPLAYALEVARVTMKSALGTDSILESGAEILQKICEKVETAKANKEELVALAKHAITLYAAVLDAVHAADPDARVKMKTGVEAFDDVLEKIYQSVVTLGQRGKIAALARSKSDKEDIADLRKDLDDATRTFVVLSQRRSDTLLDEVRRLCKQIEEREERYAQVVRGVAEKRDRELLKKVLDPDDDATHLSASSPRSCMNGTRLAVLDTIERWALSPDDPRVYWMTAPAGTGKTTITVTLCRNLQAKGCCVVSWFSLRDTTSRRNQKKMVHTLAYQLGFHSEEARREILSAITADPHIKEQGMALQAEQLLGIPLSAMTPAKDPPYSQAHPSPAPLVIFIDGLDESEGNPCGAVESLLAVLISVICRLPGHVKLLISTRGEQDTRIMLDRIMFRHKIERTMLFRHEVDRAIVRWDIRLYLSHSLSEVRDRHPRIPETWPTGEILNTLVKLSGNLFVYAATVVRFVDDTKHSPVERLGQLLAFSKQAVSSDEESSSDSLDRLYLNILLSAADAEEEGTSSIERIRLILVGILFVQDELSSRDLALLVGVDLDMAPSTFQHLSAVLTYTSNAAAVRVFHSSFSDFLTDHHRCSDARFYVSKTDCEGSLARLCLRLLTEESPALQKVVHYARTYWPYHLVCAQLLPFNDSVFLDNMEEFEERGRKQVPSHAWFIYSNFTAGERHYLAELARRVCESPADGLGLIHHQAQWLRGASLVVKIVFGIYRSLVGELLHQDDSSTRIPASNQAILSAASEPCDTSGLHPGRLPLDVWRLQIQELATTLGACAAQLNIDSNLRDDGTSARLHTDAVPSEEVVLSALASRQGRDLPTLQPSTETTAQRIARKSARIRAIHESARRDEDERRKMESEEQDRIKYAKLIKAWEHRSLVSGSDINDGENNPPPIRPDSSVVAAWSAYEQEWAELSDKALQQPLRWSDIPWPTVNVPVNLADGIDAEKIALFILSPSHSYGVGDMERLRVALRRWHPDRFEGKWLSNCAEYDKEEIMGTVRFIARCLTDLMRAQKAVS